MIIKLLKDYTDQEIWAEAKKRKQKRTQSNIKLLEQLSSRIIKGEINTNWKSNKYYACCGTERLTFSDDTWEYSVDLKDGKYSKKPQLKPCPN